MKTIYCKIILGVIFILTPFWSHAQNTFDEKDIMVDASSATQSEYLYIDVYGVGTVAFTMPAEKIIIGNGGNTYAQIPVRYGTVPGVGVLVTFSVSKFAYVVTSDGQTFSISPNETKQILIGNLSYPQITIRF